MANISSIYKLRIFGLDDVVRVMEMSRSAAAGALLRWQNQGTIRMVRRNLYVTTDPTSDAPVADKYEVASRVTDDSYVGWHTAMEFHGIAHQPFYNAFVGSGRRFANFSFEMTDFVFCQSLFDATDENGVVSPLGNPYVRVTDLERTIVDCCDRLDRAGGAEELLHCMEGITRLDEQKLTKYLEMYGKAFLYQKVGFVLEHGQLYSNVSRDFISVCRERGAIHTKRLTNGNDSDTFVNEWKLYVPKGCVMKEEDGYELV